MSDGPNELLKNGAAPITNVSDILEMCDFTAKDFGGSISYQPKNETEKRILKFLSDQNLTIDDLVRMSSMPISEISGTLTSLELAGVVGQMGEEWRANIL